MPDLVIGGRRSGAPRPWRAGVIAIAMLAVTVVVTWFIYRRSVSYDMPAGDVQGELASVQPARGAAPALAFGNASLSWLGGIAVLRASGDAHAIGAAHGRLLAPWLPPIAAAAAPSIAATVSSEGVLGGWTHGIRLAWRWRFIDDGLSEQDRRMVAGLTRGAAASGVTLGYEELVRDQAVLDVGAPSPRSEEADQHLIAHSLTLIGAQAQAPARVWIGRTVALPGLDDGGDAEIPVVTIAHPDGRLAWASVGWPGQLGAVTGINAEGIAVMVDPARTSDVRVSRTARPVALLARTVLEQARTLDDAIKLIEGSPTLGSAVIAVIDGTSGKWVQIERTPSKAIVERSPKAPALGDVLTTNALASDPENDRARRMLSTGGRVERAARLLKAPLADAAAMAAILRDQRAADDSPRPPGHRGVIDDGRAVHTAILDPASLTLWVADPRAAGRMRALDLRH
ncbi:MAG TPA: C45 family autoproteolytic acyltransferase/hydrolase, partial [Kofleriaceae bacterium]|nr:C45 family autoproteolytic acyltransferase/hydrolase [Kofleriaceae bacterium]